MHGLQFKTQALRIVPPSTLEGIEKYLGSGMVKGDRLTITVSGLDIVSIMET
jgi:exodeoxyribonuclease V alpha subunit